MTFLLLLAVFAVKGKLHFSFDQLPRNKQIEEWFNLVPVTAGEGEGTISPKESDLGAVRVKITLIVGLFGFYPPRLSRPTYRFACEIGREVVAD